MDKRLKYKECESCKDWTGCITDCMAICGKPMDALEEFNQYCTVGTVEECRDAREKRIPQKPSVLVNDHDVKVGAVIFRKGTKTYKCAVCGSFVMRSWKCCSECGQAIDWSEV